ncbi:hypothetical protein BDP27DRAFT_1076142 [Rhodocollybia butyracea]|uniref:Uncharacterized protein n=1 Tax=Rhodocollybia butyracea TaxID=206335 RepID=A0A9P5PI30_9AGAR|nr:hypothetical protein BDP27DRAFT_1076142 [Rhodocollybia butyracea]
MPCALDTAVFEFMKSLQQKSKEREADGVARDSKQLRNHSTDILTLTHVHRTSARAFRRSLGLRRRCCPLTPYKIIFPQLGLQPRTGTSADDIRSVRRASDFWAGGRSNTPSSSALLLKTIPSLATLSRIQNIGYVPVRVA